MSSSSGNRRLAAVLALDVAGYSRLMGQDEEDTHGRLQSVFRELVEPRVAAAGGRIVKRTGDGALIEFASVVQAVRCAIDIQQEMRRREQEIPAERRIRFRIGINVDDVIVESDDIYGDGVNLAVRLEGVADVGGIAVSQAVADQIAEKLKLRLVDIGTPPLKNIARGVRVYRIDIADAAPARNHILAAFTERPAIVVLPFDDFGEIPGEQYFADGITEDITTMLARWRAFPVIARNSAFAYKGRRVDVKAIGQELGVTYVVEGSVRRSRDRIRITAQLIEVATNHHLYAENFDRRISDMFEVQDEIVASVVGALEPEILRVERDRAIRSSTQDITAYTLMQRGLWHHYRHTREHGALAQDCFRRALAISPDYAACLGALSVNLAQSVHNGWQEQPQRVIAEAYDLAQRAVDCDDRDPLAHFALGLACLHTQRIETAIGENEQAVHINPSYAAAYANLGNCCNYIDEPERAAESVSRAFRLSPGDPRIFLWMPALTASHYLTGRYDAAIEAGHRALQMKPEYRHSLRYLVAALGMTTPDRAAPLLGEMRSLDGSLAQTEAFLGRYFRRSALDRIMTGLTRAGFD
jgi:adenylate cyclase